ncbi:hypothetical protein Prudu_000290 [Prunus dulcis]|uniref:Retrovirus-related Pol polyprotein from transposon TNT 1-94-like beta-barrel domain-containing protein n=1 Tax=Prunus dulcis TaxID=3755 RepID=A0A4Y1QL25_PRUDU|nr:hypothetical protein Prudu_000290 [Prunus dulcis]
MVNSLRLVRYVSPSGSVVIPLLISHEFKQFWFDMYEVDYGSKVMIGDGSVYRVEGTGTIKVKMHDSVVRTLGMVRYISNLKKNLIFLSTFDKNDYSYKAMRGKLIISEG